MNDLKVLRSISVDVKRDSLLYCHWNIQRRARSDFVELPELQGARHTLCVKIDITRNDSGDKRRGLLVVCIIDCFAAPLLSNISASYRDRTSQTTSIPFTSVRSTGFVPRGSRSRSSLKVITMPSKVRGGKDIRNVQSSSASGVCCIDTTSALPHGQQIQELRSILGLGDGQALALPRRTLLALLVSSTPPMEIDERWSGEQSKSPYSRWR
jgi:hypothetical protein